MKKSFYLVFVLVFVFLFIGCDNKDNSKTVKPTSINIVAVKTEIFVGEELKLTCNITPKNAASSVIWTSDNNEVAAVIDNVGGIIKGIGPGKAEIFVTSKVDSKVCDSVEIVVNEITYDDPESVELMTPRNTVSVNSFLQLTATVLPNTALQKVTYSSSDEEIATVSANGLVSGKSIGEVTITVTVDANPELTDSVNLSVVIGSLTVEGVVIQGDTEMFEGSTIKLTASVLPAGVSQNVTWQSSHPQIATVSDGGVVTALKQGTVTVIAVSDQDKTISASHVITVKPEPLPIQYPNLNNYEIIIFGNDGYLKEHDPFLYDYTAPDKGAKQRAWRDVEQDFNCKLIVKTYPTEAPWGDQRVRWMIEKATINEAQADVFVITGLWTKSLVEGQAISNTLEWYNKYGKHKMAPSQKTAATYKGGLYALLYSAVDGVNVYYGIFYNYNLLNSLSLESPAKLFNEGRWTYDDFKNYVSVAKSRMTEEQSVLSGKPFLYWAGMVNAGGVALTDTLTLSVNFNHQYARDAAAVLRDTYLNECWGDQGWDSSSVSFNEASTLFNVGEYWFVKSAMRWSETIWGDDTRFGYVPFPYPNNVDKEATRIADLGGQYYGFADGRNYPPGVTAESVYWASTEMILRTGDYLSQDSAYNLDAMMRTDALSRFADPESAEAIVFFKQNKVIFDPFTSLLPYSNISDSAIDPIVNGGEDYDQLLAPFIDIYKQPLIDMYG